VDVTLTALALATGTVLGALFHALQIPVPAPPELPGVMRVVGIYLGYRIVEELGFSFDLLAAPGLA
jgi:XapX domain-containing protein